MKDKEFDKLFQKSIESSKLELDIDDLWAKVEPPRKKKPWWILFLFLFGAAIFVVGYLFLSADESSDRVVGNRTELKKEAEVENANSTILQSSPIDNKQITEDKIDIINTNEKNDEASTNLSQVKKPAKETKSLTTTNQKTTETKTIVKTTESFNQTKSIVDSETLEKDKINLSTEGIGEKTIIPELIKDSINTSENEIASQEKDTEIRENSEEAKQSKIILLSSLAAFCESNDSLSFGLIDSSFYKSKKTPKFSRKQWEAGLYYGIGFYNKNLEHNDPSAAKLLNDRLDTETDRFSIYIGSDLNYWINKNIGIGLNVEYQKHYSYFQDVVEKAAFNQVLFQSSFVKNTRNVKSNIIIDQLHTGLLFHYRMNKGKFNVLLSTGLSYNLYIKGEGKLYLGEENISNINEAREPLQNSALGILGKCKIQYLWRRNIALNLGINGQYQSGIIFSNNGIDQMVRPLYLSAGISKRF